MKMCHVIALNQTSLNLSAGSVLSEQQMQAILPKKKKAQHVNLGHSGPSDPNQEGEKGKISCCCCCCFITTNPQLF